MRAGRRGSRSARWPCAVREQHDDGRDEHQSDQRGRRAVTGRATRPTVGSGPRAAARRSSQPCPDEAVGSRTWSRSPSARAVRTRSRSRRGSPSDATRRVRDGLVTARCCGAVARAWQSPRRRGDDPIRVGRGGREAPLGARARRRPLRVPAALRGRSAARPRDEAPPRAAAGAHRDGRAGAAPRRLRPAHRREDGTKARASRDPRAAATAHDAGPVCANRRRPPRSRRLAPFELRRLGLHERRGAALVRLCRSLELERLHDLPTDAVVRRIERERGLGPWSAGVVCLEGLGRFEYGLVGDLGLIKLLRALRGRPSRRDVGDGGAARAVRRVGRPRERLPPPGASAAA